MLEKIKCFLGIHSWEVHQETMGDYTIIFTRECKECGKRQGFVWQLGDWVDYN